MAETAKFRAAAFNPEVLPRTSPPFGGAAPSLRPAVRAAAAPGYTPPAFNPEVMPRATPAVDVIPETKPTFRVANPEVLPRATPPGSAYAAADSALGREAALAGERTAGKIGFRSAAGAAGRGLGVVLSAPVQVPAMAIGGTVAAANAEAQRIGLGVGGDYMSDSPASLERSRRFNPTGEVDVRNMAPEKLRGGFRSLYEPDMSLTPRTGLVPPPPEPVTTVAQPAAPEGPPVVGVVPADPGPSFRKAPVERAETQSMPRSYGFGSLFGAQVEAGAERGRRWEAEQGIRQQVAGAAQSKAETDAAKAAADLNKSPDAPKIGLTEVQDPNDPLKMRYLLTEDGVPSPTSIDPSDPLQAQALRAFTRARMAGGVDARVPFDDFLKFARQQAGGVDGGPK